MISSVLFFSQILPEQPACFICPPVNVFPSSAKATLLCLINTTVFFSSGLCEAVLTRTGNRFKALTGFGLKNQILL